MNPYIIGTKVEGPYFGTSFRLFIKYTDGNEVPKYAPSNDTIHPLPFVECADLWPFGTNISSHLGQYIFTLETDSWSEIPTGSTG